ncbi:hypothetical protein ACG02S_11760 [Roseateles sp. DC23W]|uniref:Transposase n=1 Tax=Pelomonas dachongensis TaxID=3299029 RepID=A0ABW7ERC5_9BURK
MTHLKALVQRLDSIERVHCQRFHEPSPADAARFLFGCLFIPSF